MTLSASTRVPDTLLSDLQHLGFSEYEARAYIALLPIHPATAYEVSKAAGLPKANSYAVLDSLSKKGAAQPVSKAPLRYAAVVPSVLFRKISSDMQRRCGRLQEGLDQFAEARLDDYVWSVEGRDRVIGRIEEIISSARAHLWIKASHDVLELFRNPLEAASQRGVAISIILFGEDASHFRFNARSKTWLHEGNGIPVGISSSLFTMTRDHAEAIVAQFDDHPSGSSTRNKTVVNMADSLLRHEIYIAEIFAVHGKAIQKSFGPALLQLRRKYLPPEQAGSLIPRANGKRCKAKGPTFNIG